MGEHSFPEGTGIGPDGQPAGPHLHSNPPDYLGVAGQDHGYEEVELDHEADGQPRGLQLRAFAAASTGAAPTASLTKVLNVARSQVGYKEGKNNNTKFGVWFGWNNVAYCAIGVTWTFHMAGGLAQIDGVRGSHWAYCPYFVNYFKQIGRWHTWRETPKPGDIVFFDWSGGHGTADHVGILEAIEWVGSVPVLVTLEYNTTSGIPGNQSDGGGMYRRRRAVATVAGYGRPPYAPESTPKPINPPKLMPLVVDGVWGRDTTRHLQVWVKVPTTGVTDAATRRGLQKALGVSVDGVWGPATHKALQKKLGVPQDGTWGPITIKALQKFLNRTV